MGFWGPIAAGAAQGIAGSGANALFAGGSNRAARRAADTAYNYDYFMATTQHQREVKDLLAAGLNPNLSAQGGPGASGGNAPTQQIATPQVSMPEILPAILNLKQLEQQDRKIQIDRDLADSAIIKNKTANQLTRRKIVKEGKGVIRAEAEDEAAGLLRRFMNYWLNPKPPTNNESSGGEIIPSPRMGQP